MKALSLWQPRASAIACGAKIVETRSWCTGYRGPIAIHAAKRRVPTELAYYHACCNWQGAMGWSWERGAFAADLARMPFGAIVAVANLVDCRRSETFTVSELDIPRIPPSRGDGYAWTERQMGDFAPGRYGWVLEGIRNLERPIPFKGRQLLFDVPDELLQIFVSPKADLLSLAGTAP